MKESIRERAEALTRVRAPMPFEDSFWSEHRVDVERFRSSPSFLEVDDGYDHAALTRYLLEHGEAALLDRMGNEDGAFGAERVTVGERVVSRDVLDSALEIVFLREALNSLPWRVLDIGAGYGRFAHRYCQVHRNALVTCVDAMPTSTAVCEAYLDDRAILMDPGARRGAIVLPFHEVTASRVLEAMGRPELAVNIHSWSECTGASVFWWLGLLEQCRVPWLFVVPHNRAFTTSERNGDAPMNFRAMLEAFGWRLHHMAEDWPPVASDRRKQGRNYYLFRSER